MVRIGCRRCARWLGLLALVFLLDAFGALAYLPGQQTVGRLRTIGPNVSVDGEPARDGQMITVGDRLQTGADSSAYVFFLSGGFVQLDENTDPFFRIVWDGTECGILILGIRVGQAYHEAGHQCRTVARTTHGEWTQPPRQVNLFNLKVNDQESVFTLLDGKMSLSKPTDVPLKPGQQIRVSAAGVEDIKSLSDLAQEEVTRWRKRFPPPCPGGGGECAPPGGITQCGQCTD
jgi:hypothetical protein